MEELVEKDIATCPWCVKEFEKLIRPQKYCSDYCRKRFFNREYYRKNKAKHLANARAWYHRNHKKALEQKRRSARVRAGCLNPTGETDKVGYCRICQGLKRLVYDHDHSTGKHRGWLCVGCNMKLGWFEAYAPAIVSYLEESK